MQPDTIETIINSKDMIGCIEVTNAPAKVAACNNTISLLFIIG